MSEIDRRLNDIFAADAPPARDPAFVFGVLQAEERRRLGLSVLLQAAAAVTGGALLWAALPWLAPGMEAAAPVMGVFSVAMGGALGLLVLLRLAPMGRPWSDASLI